MLLDRVKIVQSAHEPNVQNQQSLQFQNHGKSGRIHGTQSPAKILELPTELLYDVLDYSSTEDLVSFAFCRWDLFQALIGVLESKARPSLQNLGHLPIYARSEQPILRDLRTLVELFEDSHWPKEHLRGIILESARRDQPTLHSCVDLGFEEVACRYLRIRPHALFDLNFLHMTALHISILRRAHTVVQEIEIIAQNMPEIDQVEYFDRHDDLQNTPLYYAITTSSPDIASMLISAGSIIDFRDILGYTPLMTACYLGRDEVVHCLVDHGADMQATNNSNLSVLECIVIGESRTKETLLQRICPYATQAQLNRALRLAVNKKSELVGILLRFGADGQYASILEDDSYDAERNGPLSSTTHGPVEASMSLSRRHLNPSIASDLASGEPDILADLSPIMHSEASTDDGGIPRKALAVYTEDNVLGICGVAFGERKFPDRVYKQRRAVWVKIKWENIVTVDQKLLQENCSWIPRDDFTRLCGSRILAESELREAWKRQENRFINWKHRDESQASRAR
ncbi:unnamed protein product [Penicillium nalgiovense]|nr:unnamed protein product [Penicillium nalgiovense]